MNWYDAQKKKVFFNGSAIDLFVGCSPSELQLAIINLYLKKDLYTLQEWIALVDTITRKELTK